MAIRVHGFDAGETLYEGPHLTVVRAVRQRDGSAVALKVPRVVPPLAAHVEAIELDHELSRHLGSSVVPLPLERIESGSGVVLVHEMPRGEPLSAVLRERLVPDQVIAIALALCLSVGVLHDHRVIHNDLRPDGVWIDRAAGRATFLDLSSAFHPLRRATTSPLLLGDRDLTRIAPEQTGWMSRAVDHRADLYALGLILYQALHGSLPFQSTDPLALIHAHLAVPSRSPSRGERDVPDALSRITFKLLSKSPSQRYQGTFGLAEDLRSCLAALERREPTSSLALGLRDPSPCPVVPERLFGRQAPLAALRSALERARAGGSELVALRGVSGTGKTRLVEAAFRADASCRLATGKLDVIVDDKPYGGVLSMCRELTRQLLAGSDDDIAAWKTVFLERDPDAGPVIAQLLPELSLLLGPQPLPPPLDPTEGQYRLQHAFRSFIGSIARLDRPLVVFLDGMHRSEPATLVLVQQLFEAGGTPRLVIVCAFRDDETPTEHPLSRQLDAMRRSGIDVVDIELGALGIDDLVGLTASMLAMTPDEARPLAQVVRDKTAGNPHFAVEFIRGLYDDSIIRFDSATGTWRSELSRVRERAATDNVRELMSIRMEALSEGAREAVSAAACVGSEFDAATVAAAVSRSTQVIHAELAELMSLGLLFDVRDEAAPSREPGRYRFVHDRVQEAAHRLASEERRVRMHLAIAEHLLATAGPELDDEQRYAIVGHFNLGFSALEEPTKRFEVARLNLAAGQRAMASAAFEDADAYLSAALRLLPEDPWDECYEVAFRATLAQAQCAYLCSRTEDAERAFEVVLQRARTTLDEMEVHEAMALFYSNQDRSQRALEVAIDGLRLAGIRLSPNPGVFTLLWLLLVSLFRMWRVGPRAIAHLAPMAEPERLAAMRLLHRIWVPANMLNRRALLAAHALVMLDLSLRHGNSPESPLAYATIGIVHAQLGWLERGHALGRAALELAERVSDPSIRAKVLVVHAAFLAHIKEPLGNSVKLLQEGFHLHMRRGHFFEGTQVIASMVSLMPSAGYPIAVVHEWARQELQLARRIRRAQSISNAYVGMRWTSALGGLELAPEEPVDREARTKQEDEDWQALLGELLQLQVSYLLRRPKDALTSAEATLRRPEVIRLSGAFRELFSFYHALNLVVLLELGQAPRSSRRVLRKLDRYLAKAAARCPENVLHRSLLVSAEIARLDERVAQAAELYERALAQAAKSGFQHEDALAHELAGRFYLRDGWVERASHLLRAARHGYEAWGARAKVEHLVEELGSLAAEPAPAAGGSQRDLQLDLGAVIESSQAISGEIVLEELLGKLMRMMLEYAGAERGLLVLERDGARTIEATGAVGEDVVVGPSVPAEVDPRLPTSVIHFVARTGESVVLDDATVEGPFVTDPYMVERRPKSVLAAPLFNQGKLIAILYLENNLLVGAFTADRLKVVVLLLAQAALSIHNATLYASLKVSNERLAEYSRTLEQKVEERTRELRQAQRQLVTQEKLASLGTLTAGIAHELKNPLNFVTHFAELSGDLIGDLKGDLSEPEAVADATRADIDETLDLLELNISKISEHGKRANRIIDGMLLHSRASAGTREEADVNALLAESAAFACQAMRSVDRGFTVEIRSDYDPAIGRFELVPEDIRRVFVNVLSNACYAMREKANTSGPGYIPVLELRSKDLEERVELRIRDNGTGISPDIVDKIYTPFFTTKPPGEGTGLGLSLSHDIVVDGHGGELRVETQPGELTEFVITLPKRRTRSEELA